MPKDGGLMIAIGLPKRPPALGAPGQRPAPKEPEPELAPKPEMAEESNEQGGIPPNPEAVCFRTEAQTCGHCSYMEGDSCAHPIVAMPVQPGDSCGAFEAKGGEREMGGVPMDRESQSSEQEYAG